MAGIVSFVGMAGMAGMSLEILEMEAAKLTLRPSRQVVELAHRLAEAENTSITQLFSSFVLTMHQRRHLGKFSPAGPITQLVTGILKVPEGWDFRREMGEILDEKYDQAVR